MSRRAAPKEQTARRNESGADQNSMRHTYPSLLHEQFVLKQPTGNSERELLLPGALLVTMGAQLLAPFVFIDLCFSPFFQ
jgi:hypothetical protein